MDLSKYKGAPITRKPNYLLIPVSTINIDEEGVKEFNKLFNELKNSGYNKIIRTPSGGISYSTKIPAWDIRNTTTVIELTILDYEMYRIQIRNIKMNNNPSGINGSQAFRKFKEILLNIYNIDLNDYIIENGAEVKKTIEKPLIKLEKISFKDKTYEEVHHIDFHNSYPAGLVNTHPEFKDAITTLYNLRKTDEIYKAILNLSIGYMQSEKCCKAKWANLARDAIADNNKRLLDMAQRLKESGRVILSYNTDGIWYCGNIYHGKGEGSELGQWHNDHINCKWRAKSAGAYEFIEDNKYYPVLRGHTKLDEEKPRTEWVWGDIYNNDCKVIEYVLTDDGLEEVINEYE